jgi:predicted nucleic acid-binding protein
VIVLDSSVIYALLDAMDHLHEQARDWYAEERDELVTTPLVLAEADHLAMTRGGERAASAFQDDVRSGAYRVGCLPIAAARRCCDRLIAGDSVRTLRPRLVAGPGRGDAQAQS